MNSAALIESLHRFIDVLPPIVRGVSEDDARWRPEQGGWSILEVLTHMADEEVEDFRTRLKSTLEDPSRVWPPIDPEAWSRERRYNENDPGETLTRFIEARRESVAWLRTLESPVFENHYTHPVIGEIRAGDLLASWVAHDLLHLRQITKRIYELAMRDAAPYSGRYAGRWTS